MPTGLAAFPNELMHCPKSWAQIRYQNIYSYTFLPQGGHFAAFEEPQLLASDFVQFVKKVEASWTCWCTLRAMWSWYICSLLLLLCLILIDHSKWDTNASLLRITFTLQWISLLEFLQNCSNIKIILINVNMYIHRRHWQCIQRLDSRKRHNAFNLLSYAD